MNAPIKLIDYLTQGNPSFKVAIARSKLGLDAYAPNTPTEQKPTMTPTSKKGSHVIPKEMHDFSDFNLQTIREIYGERLNQVLGAVYDNLADFSHIHPAFLSIHDEDALDALLVKHNQSIVLEALDKTPEELIPHRVVMVRGGQAVLLSSDANRKLPDWAGRTTRQGFRNVLPGDTKPSWCFHSAEMRKAYDPVTGKVNRFAKACMPAVIQVLQYCIDSNARYGYIITNKELVVIRVSSTDQQTIDPKDYVKLRETVSLNPLVECLVIPWDHETSSTRAQNMTINLALWFLHILAANNGDLQNKAYEPLAQERIVQPEQQPVLEREDPKAAKIAKDTPQSTQRGRRRAPEPAHVDLIPMLSQPKDGDDDGDALAESFDMQVDGPSIPRTRRSWLERSGSLSQEAGSGDETQASPTPRETRGQSKSNQYGKGKRKVEALKSQPAMQNKTRRTKP